MKPTKEEEISDEMVMEEEIQEEIAQDGFFMGGGASDGGGSGGIPGLDDGDDNNKEKERNERDLRNRSIDVNLEDLQSEFQETIMNEENCFSQGSTHHLLGFYFTVPRILVQEFRIIFWPCYSSGTPGFPC